MTGPATQSGAQPAMWHASAFVPPDHGTVARTLAATLADVAAAWPDAPAVIDRGTVVRFADLTRRVGGLAAQIAAATPDDGPVALLQTIGIDVVAAWFACALAGRPFLLLEPGNPPERNRALMARAGVTTLLCDATFDPAIVAGRKDIVVLRPDGRLSPMAHDNGLDCDAPAMIFPTSGSGGEPKLITYSARTLQTKVQASIALMGATPGDRVLIAGSHSNYGFLHHAMVFLLSGGTLCLADLASGGLTDTFETIVAHDVRNVRFTPSLFRVAARHAAGLAALQKLDAVRFSGEPLMAADLELARKTLAPGCRIQNVYGSTESGLFVWTDDHSRPVPSHTVPIGQIYPLWEFAILDEDGSPVPAGDLGELTIASPHHALGDWHAGTLDGTRFPPDSRGNQRRIYCTGDIVRLGQDGHLTLVGRKDRLVKINGMRVSLDEIEAHLRAMPGCTQAAVLEVAGGSGKRLAAFLTGNRDTPEAGDALAWLGARLPRHMIPAPIRWLAEMPLLPGGKIDRKALLASLPIAGDAGDTIDPGEIIDTGDPYADLTAIWRRLLKLPDFDRDAEFFGLGGDSLLMLQMQLAVEKRFDRSFPIEGFLAQPTMRGLATLLGLATLAGMAQPTRQDPELATRFRRVRPASGLRHGTVICMPGLGGAATAELLAKSRMFARHDLWACDVRISEGTLLHDQRWLTAAIAAARKIEQGDVPRPDILVGYSIGGYLAWLVARLLDQSRHRPARVVTIDTKPMHRDPKHQSAELDALLEQTRHADIDMLAFRRNIPAPFVPAGGPPIVWLPEDGNVITIPVETLEHLDMIKSAVLDRIADAVNCYSIRGRLDDLQVVPVTEISTPSGKLNAILRRGASVTCQQIADLLKNRKNTYGRTTLSALLYLALIYADSDEIEELCAQIINFHPEVTAARHAMAMLAKFPNTVRVPTGADLAPGPPDDIIVLPSLPAVDRALRLRQARMDRAHPPGSRHALM